jgi:hydrogenase maturation protease
MILQSNSGQAKPVVIFAIGNPSRGDDALGPLLLDRLAAWLDEQGLATQFDLIEDFQLQIEHALDLQDREIALFIDAGEQTPGPFRFYPVVAASGALHTTHQLPPAAVLQVYALTETSPAPPAFTLCIRGESFELGADLSPIAEQNLDSAFSFLKKLLLAPDAKAWAVAAEGGI